MGRDVRAVVRNLMGRFEWIWEHDLQGDVRAVERRFGELVGEGGEV